ncbi:MAG: cysteine desulfurase NifS [Naasia sp.]|nr:cysteine desulfurase NifS [Naasia sp.]
MYGVVAVYLDHAATTPLLPEVLEAYTAALAVAGNPASLHAAGRDARRMLEEAREKLAGALGCDPVEVVFTSGGTEAINTALKGIFWARTRAGASARIAASGVEHHATLDTLAWLAGREGAEVVDVAVDGDGRILPAALDAALAGGAAVATAIWANNEVGTVSDIPALAAVAAFHGVPLHVDAVQALGAVPVDFRGSGAAALSVSAHKIGGPVGVGALIVGRRTAADPLLHGGGQQRGIRSGTQDVAGAVAFALAATLAVERRGAAAARTSALRDRLIRGVLEAIPDAVLRGALAGPERLPGNAHFTFAGCDGDSLLFLLDTAEIAVSTGAACAAGVAELSHVLLAMGVDEAHARGALRFTFGASTTEADVDAVLRALPDAVARARRAARRA